MITEYVKFFTGTGKERQAAVQPSPVNQTATAPPAADLSACPPTPNVPLLSKLLLVYAVEAAVTAPLDEHALTHPVPDSTAARGLLGMHGPKFGFQGVQRLLTEDVGMATEGIVIASTAAEVAQPMQTTASALDAPMQPMQETVAVDHAEMASAGSVPPWILFSAAGVIVVSGVAGVLVRRKLRRAAAHQALDLRWIAKAEEISASPTMRNMEQGVTSARSAQSTLKARLHLHDESKFDSPQSSCNASPRASSPPKHGCV